MRTLKAIVIASLLLFAGSWAEAADVKTEATTVGGAQAILLTPAKPRGGIVLLAGGNGMFQIDANGNTQNFNSLVRTRYDFAAHGLAVLVPEANVDVKAAVDFMRKFGKVTVAGTSRGTQRAARAIAAGARPDRLVLTSGLLSNASGDPDNVINIIGSPSALPPTLVVAHRHDSCFKTLPAGVDPFLAWAGGKARVTWIDGGDSQGNACGAKAHHGFLGVESQMVNAVAGFAR